MLAFSTKEMFGQQHSQPGAHISNLDVEDAKSGSEIVGLLFGSVIFGAIHLTAWNFHYPTKTEQLLWQIASLWCTCFFIVDLVIILALDKVDNAFPFDIDKIVILLIELSLMLYVVARLYLLVEIFRTLFFLPPSAYISTWATNVPHVA